MKRFFYVACGLIFLGGYFLLPRLGVLVGAVALVACLCLALVIALGPAWRGAVPTGGRYWWWLFCLMVFEIAIQAFGAVATDRKEESKLLAEPAMATWQLVGDLICGVVLIVIIARAAGLFRQPNAILPIFPWRKSWIWLLSLLMLIPLYVYDLDGLFLGPESERPHPLLITIKACWMANPWLGGVIGGLYLIVVTPIHEELFFRGLCLKSYSGEPYRWWRQGLVDVGACVVFALIHLPVSFCFPLMVGGILTFIRRQTGTLLWPMLIHAGINTLAMICLLWLGC